MTNDQICRWYDNNPDMTLTQLSQATGKTIEQLTTILSSPPTYAPVYVNRQRGICYKYSSKR